MTRAPGPTDSTQGARMKTARSGPPAMPSTRRSSSWESIWRPKALRLTTMSRAPKHSWSSRPSTMVEASTIMPAHDP